MFSKLKQFKDLRDKAKKIQDVLKDVTVEGSGGWGKVKMAMNGNQEVTSVSIDQSLVGDKGKLESAVKDAVNDTIKRAQRAMADQMKKTGGLDLPGLT
jgi:DNA-binding YbaB/EbfC family protein